jgi:nucleotide-binding universal stress UspA family protein
MLRRLQLRLCPQTHFAIPGLARERDALLHQAAAHAEAPRFRLDQQHAQQGNPRRVLHQENRADR